MKTEEKESEGTGECSAGDEGQERREEKREQTDPSRSPFPRPPRLPVSVLVGTVYTQTETQAKCRLQTYSWWAGFIPFTWFAQRKAFPRDNFMAQKSNCKNYDTVFYFIAKYKSVLGVSLSRVWEPEQWRYASVWVPLPYRRVVWVFGFFFLPPSTVLNISGLPVKAGR